MPEQKKLWNEIEKSPTFSIITFIKPQKKGEKSRYGIQLAKDIQELI